MTNMKFRVTDKAHNEAVQRALFEMGFQWGNQAPNTLLHAPYCEVNFLYAEDGQLLHGEMQSTFDGIAYPEYMLYEGKIVPSYPAVLHQSDSQPAYIPIERLVGGDFRATELRAQSIILDELESTEFQDVPEVEDTRKRQHKLRSWTMFFNGILDGTRTSDIRWTGDRHFIVGDYLLLQEYDAAEECYTGREQRVQITYIQQNKSNPCAISHLALADDYAVLSIKLVA